MLEVLRILKGEVDLRESTRVAEQTKTAMTLEDYVKEATQLRDTQAELNDRLQMIMERLVQLQFDEAKDYSQPLQQLEVADRAMRDATQLLAMPETGPPAIAAETEAIEALLITKRASAGSGGGAAGSTPGGGRGEGQADEPSALAGIGEDSLTEDREVAQSTGANRSQIPAEFRGGMDAYFSAIDDGQ